MNNTIEIQNNCVLHILTSKPERSVHSLLGKLRLLCVQLILKRRKHAFNLLISVFIRLARDGRAG